MEEYLQNLQSLRSQMNDIDEVAAKRMAEEQRQRTAIDALEKDIILVTSEATLLKVQSEELEKENAEICNQIFEKQKKISSLENEISTLSQSLELLRQQIVSASAGLKDKRLYFAKFMKDQDLKLQQGHDWLNSYNQKIAITNLKDNSSMSCNKLVAQVQSKKSKYEELKARNSLLQDENGKSKLLIMQLKQKTTTFTPTLQEMDLEALEEENKALLSDEAGELEYLKSLKDQIKQIKGASHAIKCHQCGEDYMVEMMGHELVPGINLQDSSQS